MTHPRPASLARRALPALAALGASGILLTRLGDAEHVGAELLTVDDAARSTLDAPPVTTAPLAAPPTTAPQPGRGQRTTPPTAPGTSPAPSAPSTTVPAAPTPAPGAAACTGTTSTGSSVTTRFGPVQVAAVIGADDALCDVQVLAYPDGDRRSLSINQRALPTLRTQAIASDGENVSGITGATVTTDAYRTSLQSALDKVR
jgi:uncharacterized protein with FMN-binding domain